MSRPRYYVKLGVVNSNESVMVKLKSHAQEETPSIEEEIQSLDWDHLLNKLDKEKAIDGWGNSIKELYN